MIIDGYECPDYLLKCCEKREYAEDIINGKLFLHESGYFRKLDDNFRGDKYDGRFTANLTDSVITFLNDDGERIELPSSIVKNMSMGFEKDNKVPLCCFTYMDKNILEKTQESHYRFKASFLNEIEKFGQFVAIINMSEFIPKLIEYCKEKNLSIKYMPVKYQEPIIPIGKQIYDGHWSDAFFIKNISYSNQNEWRFALFNKDGSPLIDDDDDCYILELGKLEYSIIISLDEMKKSNLKLKEND